MYVIKLTLLDSDQDALNNQYSSYTMYITKHQGSSDLNAPLIKHRCLVIQNSIIRHQGPSSQARWTKMLSHPTSIVGNLQHKLPDPPSTCPPPKQLHTDESTLMKPPNFRHDISTHQPTFPRYGHKLQGSRYH